MKEDEEARKDEQNVFLKVIVELLSFYGKKLMNFW
jgi:hypothetical protein